jgi:mannose-6-phosphate isomerase-like protein (cupin superfamily)
MAPSKYKATTLPDSKHEFVEYHFAVQECSFDDVAKQTRASTTNPGFGGKYTYTIAIDDVWENAHFHDNQSETYILESGEAVLVLMEDNYACPRRLIAGVAVNIPDSRHHKVWMKKGAKLHTVKAAATKREDAGFQPSPHLEDLCDEAGLDSLLERAMTRSHDNTGSTCPAEK